MSQSNEQLKDFDPPKETWGPGPWQDEPDKIQWKTATGLPGLIVRNSGGALCGYVGVPKEHRLYGVGYSEKSDALDDESPESRFDVHGGLTYSDFCCGHVCHVPGPGEPDDVWWFGFDTCHWNDLMPGHEAVLRPIRSVPRPLLDYRVYRDVEWVKAEVEKLAEQIAAVK